MGGAPSQELTLAEKRYRVDRPPLRKTNGSSSTSTSLSSPTGTAVNSKLEPPSPNNSDSSFAAGGTSAKSQEGSGEHLTPDEQKNYLTKRQRLLIENSWKKAKKTGAEHVGAKIFLMVLTSQPDIKAIFGLEKIPQGRLKYDPRFRQHAQVFTKTFDYIVKNLDYPEKIEEHFEALGRRHVAFQGRGFYPEYWETFAECMTQTAIEWEGHRARHVYSIWRTLVAMIITYMRRGFDDENARRRFTLSGSAKIVKASVRIPSPRSLNNITAYQ